VPLALVDSAYLVDIAQVATGTHRAYAGEQGPGNALQGNQAMADEDKPKKCSGCNGEGGWWDTGNGQKFKNRRWIKCPTCNGTGKAS
jgi:DnaJ-class molecular chaperone